MENTLQKIIIVLSICYINVLANNKINSSNPESEVTKECRIFFNEQPKLRDYYLNEFLLAYIKDATLVNQTNHTISKIPSNFNSDESVNRQGKNILEEYNKCENITDKVTRLKKELREINKEFKVNTSNFEFIIPLGKGAIGKAWKVKEKNTNKVFVLKTMLKGRVISKINAFSVVQEMQILSYIKHPCIVNIHYAFQDFDYIYLVSEYAPGGDLYHALKKTNFTENQSKFLISCLLLGLDYIHSKGIIHKDIKPSNLLFDRQGYLKLGDFGVAEVLKLDNNLELSGTVGYKAPEVTCSQNHGPAVDYFSIGIILYELMFHQQPYKCKTYKEYTLLMLKNPVYVKENEIPEGWSYDAADFINKLITIAPAKRLGYNGFDEVKNHPWLQDVEWDKILNHSFIPTIKPVKDKISHKKARAKSTWNDYNSTEYELILEKMKDEKNQEKFIDYWYDENNHIYKEIFK